MRRMRMSEWCERTDERASVPVLASGFLVDLVHSAAVAMVVVVATAALVTEKEGDS